MTPSSTAPAKRSINPLYVVLGLSFGFFLLFMIVWALMFLRSPSSSPATGVQAKIFGQGVVGVVEVNGVIMDSKKVLKQLRAFDDDPEVKAVVVRLNSPGGSVGPSQEIYDAVKRMKKPTISSMGAVAASGAYYIAAGTQKIYANAGTITGSIGVIMEFINLEKLYEWAKVRRYSIKTGKFKDSGTDTREMTEEERALLQAMVNDVLMQFKTAVSEGRKIPISDLENLADGRIFSGSQAKSVKLVDELGGLDDAVMDAAKLAKIELKEGKRPRVVYPDRNTRPRVLDYLLEDARDDELDNSSRMGGLVSLLARAFGITGGATPALINADASVLSPGIYWLWTGGR